LASALVNAGSVVAQAAMTLSGPFTVSAGRPFGRSLIRPSEPTRRTQLS
jgi:hypothetical protein